MTLYPEWDPDDDHNDDRDRQALYDMASMLRLLVIDQDVMTVIDVTETPVWDSL